VITLENILAYTAFINILAFLVFWQDKRASARGGWRVSEFVLLVFCLFGGSLGAYFSMKKFRHKTKKGSFRWRFWAIVILQILLLGFYIFITL
jgi:uncharacterized membrane protein YsdA (DUF1294 family)